jgi:hypothetical protein
MAKKEKNPYSNYFDTPGGRSGTTPGGPEDEDEECLNHEYYEISMKILILLLTGKEKQIKGLIKEIKLDDVFFEEPID